MNICTINVTVYDSILYVTAFCPSQGTMLEGMRSWWSLSLVLMSMVAMTVLGRLIRRSNMVTSSRSVVVSAQFYYVIMYSCNFKCNKNIAVQICNIPVYVSILKNIFNWYRCCYHLSNKNFYFPCWCCSFFSNYHHHHNICMCPSLLPSVYYI